MKSDPDYFLALEDISFKVRVGERVGIIGKNGAGKSTLLKLISRNFEPSSGVMSVKGTIQALLQSGVGFHPELTGRENIRSSLQYMMVPTSELAKKEQEIIEFAELGKFIDQSFRTYSLGMQARLQFSTAMAIDPEILVIDEVLGAGDIYFAAKAADRVQKLAFSGCTLVVVSHDLRQIASLCERVLWVDAGRIVMDGDTQSVINAYEALAEEASSNGEVKSGMGAPDLSEWMRGKMNSTTDDLNTRSQPESSSLFEFADGSQGWRWPGSQKVMFRRIETKVSISKRAHPPFHDLEILFELEANVESSKFRIFTSIFGLDGQRKAWIISDPILVRQGMCRVKVEAKPLLLDTGNYLLSNSIFQDGPLTELGNLERYDLVSRSLQISVAKETGLLGTVYFQPTQWEVQYGVD